VSVLEPVQLQIVQVAEWRDGTAPLAARLQSLGWELPPLGQVTVAGGSMALAVQPRRWLLLDPAPEPDLATACQRAIGDAAAVVDLSSALRAWRLVGPDARSILAHGCRLDLDPRAFPSGKVASTLIAQLTVILAALPQDWLLLSASTTAGHFADWLRDACDAAENHDA
jgi:sarcosine oxidase, subunit gamma